MIDLKETFRKCFLERRKVGNVSFLDEIFAGRAAELQKYLVTHLAADVRILVNYFRLKE